MWVGEFGRTPRINRANSGREHWPHCYSAVLAGAGVRGGSIYGASDRWAAYPASDPVRPEDLARPSCTLSASTRQRMSRMPLTARCGSTRARRLLGCSDERAARVRGFTCRLSTAGPLTVSRFPAW